MECRLSAWLLICFAVSALARRWGFGTCLAMRWPNANAMLDPALRIFLVDDDPYCRGLMEHAVRNYGCADVQLFDNGAACLDALIEEPDLIFLDQMMGSVSGTDALRAIKRFNPDTYVVLVSGQSRLQVAVDALKLGAFDYVVKDEHLGERLVAVLDKIGTVRALLAQRQPRPRGASRLRVILSAFFSALPLLLPKVLPLVLPPAGLRSLPPPPVS